MRTTILVIWTIGLLGALPATLTVLKLAQLVVSALIDIGELATMTRDAARGIDRNVAPVPTLPDVSAPARQLVDHARRLAIAMRMLDEHVEHVEHVQRSAQRRTP
jgi:hypothetical protein